MRFHKLPYAVALVILIYPNHVVAQQDQQEPSAPSDRRGGPTSTESLERTSRSAEQGDVFAQQVLGLMYGSGGGVTQDYIRAYMWVTLAREGFAQAGNYTRLSITEGMLDSFIKKMTPQQIEEAQRPAREWKSTHVQTTSQAQENMQEPSAAIGGCSSGMAITLEKIVGEYVTKL
jgi:hypothetical protein